VIGFKVLSLEATLAGLAAQDIHPIRGVLEGPDGLYAELRDPDGRAIVLSEGD